MSSRRIDCLSAETVETLYLLGEQQRIVGISGFARRPPRAWREKPRIAAFASARIDAILTLEPDLVLGFSDIQADIAAELIRRGVPVHVFNHRSVDGIFAMIRMLGAMVNASERAASLIAELQAGLRALAAAAVSLCRQPRVYFEEWNEPLISSIRWVSELIELAGSENCFAELARAPLARQRIIADPMEVVRRNPDIISGSWCGKRFRPEQVAARPGWGRIVAVRAGQLHEIDSDHILQAGPAALTAVVRQIDAVIRRWSECIS